MAFHSRCAVRGQNRDSAEKSIAESGARCEGRSIFLPAETSSVVRAETPVRAGFHHQVSLHLNFREEREAARRAGARARAVVRARALEEERSKQHALETRWYRHCGEGRGGVAKARRRVKAYAQEEARRKSKEEKEAAERRWYMVQKGRLGKNGLAVAKRNAKAQAHKWARESEDAQREKEEKQVRVLTRMAQIMQASQKSFERSRRIDWEAMRYDGTAPPFRPGPYRNNVQSTYAEDGRVAAPRRLFGVGRYDQMFWLRTDDEECGPVRTASLSSVDRENTSVK